MPKSQCLTQKCATHESAGGCTAMIMMKKESARPWPRSGKVERWRGVELGLLTCHETVLGPMSSGEQLREHRNRNRNRNGVKGFCVGESTQSGISGLAHPPCGYSTIPSSGLWLPSTSRNDKTRHDKTRAHEDAL